MTDQEGSEGPKTEGVRIIGAQEAAEAVSRPDVVRRRRKSEKRFGDRPDVPESDSDLPKIRISTSETSGDHDSSLGAVPVVRPPADDDSSTGSSGRRRMDDDLERFGHARLLDSDSLDTTDIEADEREGDLIEVEESGSWDDRPLLESEHDIDGDDWAIDDPLSDDGDDLDISDEDPSFVLPHWTEPPTGQVPSIVTGGVPIVDQSTSDSPRWHSEGERMSSTDFTDLIEDGPRLGALEDRFDDSEESPDFFDDDMGVGTLTNDDDFFESDDDDVDVDDDLGASGAGERGGRRGRGRGPSGQGPSDGDVEETASGGDRDLTTAVLVGLALVGVGLFCFWLGGLATTVLVAVILVIAASEAIAALNTRGFGVPMVLALPAIVGLLLGTYFAGVDAYPVVLGLVVITSMLWYLWVAPGPRAALKLGGTLVVIMWVGFLGSFATLILGVGREMQSLDTSLKTNPGIGVLIAAVVVTVSHDVGAYFVGRYFGSTPLSKASPKKTYEGLAGGVLAGIIVPVLVLGIPGLDPIGASLAQMIVFAALCSAVAPLGDLCQSAIKRDLKVKDMGTILPGHGGVLDRFDALLFVLPTAYFVTLLMGIWTVSGS